MMGLEVLASYETRGIIFMVVLASYGWVGASCLNQKGSRSRAHMHATCACGPSGFEC